MPATYEPIATTTLGSNTASITFSSIPATYTDLVIVLVGNATSGVSTKLNFNSDTGSNYSQTTMYGAGTTAASTRGTNTSYIDIGGFSAAANDINTHRIHIMNYANTTTNKTVVTRGDGASFATQTRVGLWRSTAAINTVSLAPDNPVLFLAGTTATLYGIAAA